MTNHATNEHSEGHVPWAVVHFDMYGALHPAIFVRPRTRPESDASGAAPSLSADWSD